MFKYKLVGFEFYEAMHKELSLLLTPAILVVAWSLTHSLSLSQFFKLQSLSNMTKLILLDSLLQEVCINSGLTMKMCIAA